VVVVVVLAQQLFKYLSEWSCTVQLRHLAIKGLPSLAAGWAAHLAIKGLPSLAAGWAAHLAIKGLPSLAAGIHVPTQMVKSKACQYQCN